MSIDYSGFAIPKGPSRKQIKAKKDREDAKQLKAFRDAVWLRAEGEADNWLIGSGYARCHQCRAMLSRLAHSSYPMGEVHHQISRRHRVSRYDPANGILLCRTCHQAVTDKRITV